MKRLGIRALTLAATQAGLVAALASSAASCAESVSDTVDASGEPLPADDAGQGGSLIGGDADTPCTTDAGCPLTCAEAAWCPVPDVYFDPSHALTAIWGRRRDDVWAVGAAGTILHFDGVKWLPVASGTTNTLQAVWGDDANEIWAVSTRGLLLHGSELEDGTLRWDPNVAPIVPWSSDFNTEFMMRAVWGSAADDVWVGGDPIVRATATESGWRRNVVDGGSTWKDGFAVARIDRVTVRGIWGSGRDDIWIVGGEARDPGRAFHATGADDGGAIQWMELDTASRATLNAVWGSSANDVWSVGNLGAIRRFHDGASKWEEVPSPTRNALRSVWGSSENDVWAVGDEGTIVHFDGTRWERSTTALPVENTPHLRGVWGSGPDDVWAVGEGVLLHFEGTKGVTQ